MEIKNKEHYRKRTETGQLPSSRSSEAEVVYEGDMRIHPCEGDLIEKIYAKYPLLGSYLLSEKNRSRLFENSRKYVEFLLKNPEAKPGPGVKRQLTLALVQYAKTWDTEDENAFWRYITAQFGYRDDSGVLRTIFCACTKDALLQSNRWFVTGFGENLYKSSIMVHAFAPQKAWFVFCDFLFDFYKTNLKWIYIEQDSMFPRMISVLSKKLHSTGGQQEEDIEISSKTYYFREDIKRLILQKPHYAAQLAERMVHRIDELMKHTASSAACYEEELCDSWMEHKLLSFSEQRQRGYAAERHTVVMDYSRIQPRFRLTEEGEVELVFPDVRLTRSEFSSLMLVIRCEGRVVEQRSLRFYGNELGRTMSGFSIRLEDYLQRAGSKRINPEVIIRCDGEELYHSGKALERSFLLFKDHSEMDSGTCVPGGYVLFVPAEAQLECSNVELTPIRETSLLRGVYVELQREFMVNLNGELMLYDHAAGEKLRVVIPSSRYRAEYIAGGKRYSIMSGREAFHLILPDSDLEKRYRLMLNEEVLDLNYLPCERVKNSRIYHIGLKDWKNDELTLSVADFSSNRLLIRQHFKILEHLFFQFNREFYYSKEDYKDARLSVRTSQTESLSEYPVSDGDEWIRVPCGNGELELQVPAVRLTDGQQHDWQMGQRIWGGEILQECFLYAKLPPGVSAELYLDEQAISSENGAVFALGNAVAGYSNTENRERLILRMVLSSASTSRSYPLGLIALTEQFWETPKLWVEGNRLFWNRGHGFTGVRNSALTLRICNGTEYERELSLDLDSEKIDEQVELPLGEYRFTILRKTYNLFSLQSTELASGSFYVGDENELRFLRHCIQIDAITFEEGKSYEEIRIRPCFIDRIEYKGIQFVESEGRECPVYNGILFFKGQGGRTYEYSYEDRTDEWGHRLYQMNPVKIVYINDRTLSLTHETGDPEEPGDGFYYYRFFDKYRMQETYQLTDREPARSNQQNYYLADLYIYSRKAYENHV